MNNSRERKKRLREKRDNKGLNVLSRYSWDFLKFMHKIGNYWGKYIFNRNRDFVLNSQFLK